MTREKFIEKTVEYVKELLKDSLINTDKFKIVSKDKETKSMRYKYEDENGNIDSGAIELTIYT